METQIFLDSKFAVKEAVTHGVTLSVDKFKTNAIFSWLFEKTGQVCGGFGYSSEMVVVRLNTNF